MYLSNAEIQAAYRKLEPQEKEVIDQQIKLLLDFMKEKYKYKSVSSQFGKQSALELLAKIGIWLNED